MILIDVFICLSRLSEIMWLSWASSCAPKSLPGGARTCLGYSRSLVGDVPEVADCFTLTSVFLFPSPSLSKSILDS